MTPRAKELAATILQIIADGNLGTDATGHFAKLDDIINEIGDKQDTLSVLNSFLLPMKYIRKINDRFEEIHKNKLEYKAYQITALGKNYLSQQSAMHIDARQNHFGNIYGSNISISSQYVSQIIDKQEDETKELLRQLLEVTEKKDKSAILKTLGYIGDKSLDLLIAIIAGGVKL
ncbi:MAG: hypothetical protein V4702_03735 [Patescibacteria group bacterium]